MVGSRPEVLSGSSPLLVDVPSSGVTRLRLNRPQARNALNLALRQELARAFETLDRDDAVRCVVLCASGPHFAVGADLTEVHALGAADIWRQQVMRYWKSIADFSKPVIASVHGAALGGGCELALHADVIVAGRGAVFGQPEINLGMMPGGGATQRLVKVVGKYRAMKLMLTGQSISADEAFAMGMVSEVVPDERTEARALELADHIAARSPVATRLIKEAVLAGAESPLNTGLLLERRSFELLFDTAEQKAGVKAFLGRRASPPSPPSPG